MSPAHAGQPTLSEIIGYELRYGRDDIDQKHGGYDRWYSNWMKTLARTKTRAELLRMLGIAAKDGARYARQHLRAIDASHSMHGNSQRRAHARNCVSASGDAKIAIHGALEIYDLYPEHTRDGS